jgi:mannose-6-phosphate isomerase
MIPIRLEYSVMPTFYRGGKRLRAWRAGASQSVDGIENSPEEWLGSTTTRFGDALAGLTRLTDGTLLKDAVASDPMAWLGHEADGAPFLAKFIDAGQRLPVHAHPTDEEAQRLRLGCVGKAEAWVILEAEADAAVFLGFRRAVEQTELFDWFDRQDSEAMLQQLNRIPVRSGDVFYVPPGIPHAIGEGIVLFEVQQPSDISLLVEWTGFAPSAQAGVLGCPVRDALSTIDCSDFSRQINSLRSSLNAPGATASVLPSDADRYFSLRRAAIGGDLGTGYRILVIARGQGRLLWDGGDAATGNGDAWILPADAHAVLVGDGVEGWVAGGPVQ